MDTVELLAKFADPETMKTLSATQRLAAGLITTVLGMGITLVSLIILQFVMDIMARMTAEKSLSKQTVQPSVVPEKRDDTDVSKDEEIVAAISTALAMQLQTSVSNIVIRNIEKVDVPSTAWHRAGIAEHMNNSL